MFVPIDWLSKFVTIPKGVSPEDLAKTLTIKTAEVEGVKRGNELLDGVLVGLVKELKPHPNADKLRIATVSLGEKGEKTVVCGGQNLKEGMLVAVASPGCKVVWHGQGEPVVLEKVKIRGVESDGMICASEELGLKKPVSEGPEDILDLSSIKPNPGEELAEILGLKSAVLEFDNKSLTHRPDLWGIYGIAREISAIYKTPLKPLNPTPKIPQKGDKEKVEITAKELCPRYCAIIIKNVKIQSSPDWMKKLLNAAGHTCYNNIVDVTNYISQELGQPLHAFDKRLIKKGIVVRTANKGEKITTLDGETRNLTEEMLLIADHEKPIAIAGVMGGEHSSIGNDTTEIVIESATFNGANVRRTSTKLGLRTEAVQRFEKELDPALALTAIKKAAELILEVSPGAVIAGPITDIGKFDKKPRKISLKLDRINSKIGVQIKKEEVKKILTSLGFSVSPSLVVTVPSFRAQKDVATEDDIVEEIARIHGYEEIPALLPSLPTKLPLENEERKVKHNLRKLLTLGLGFDEIMTYSFYSKKDFSDCGLAEKNHVQIENYLSEDQTHMRISLIPNLLKKAYVNSKYLDEFKIFEIGRTYKNTKDYFPLEEKWITGIVATKDKKQGGKPFFEAKGAIEEILKHLKLPAFKLIKDIDIPYANPAKSATLLTYKGETLGRIFVIHPLIAKKFDLEKFYTAAFELNFSLLMKLEKKVPKHKELPKFPPIIIDVSVVVDKNKILADVEKEISFADKQLIHEIEFFDLYEGENIGKDKKSLTFKVTLQAEDRTLNDKEMAEVQKKIFENLQKDGGIIRGM